ncbi:taurine transport system ATP-binding protein [Pseudovibrio denitrificans]|uniref:Taurine transport system ATP-binding protein n=2 Tax=Stappiaceae TaxID=2821832 RepID=A0A1I7CS96_9HYPH|nr:taurine transport system ATP-binding protein [Pseudovibrio denitrificans]
MSGIVADNISMVFTLPNGDQVHALNNVNLNVKDGEIISVLGPSGCGKTTLLNIIAGFLRPTSGKIVRENVDVTGPGPDRGMVFQQGALFEWMTVEKNIAFGPKMAGRPAAETKRKVDELLQIVGLQDFGKKPVYQLSGGMQQRVALARCLANDPEVILMDEPLGALDALTREKMQSLVLKLWKETRKTIILITHSVEEALFLGERLIVMAPRPGRILREYELPFADLGLVESPRQIKASPEFVKTREEILSLIWGMEEEIMGNDQELEPA